MSEWKEVPGFAGYEASTDGQIRRKDGKVLKQALNWNGYMQATLKDEEGKQRHVMVSRIVLGTFTTCTADTKTTQVDHINHCKTDNRLSNLRWANPKENKRYEVEHNPLRYRRYYNERPVVRMDNIGREYYYHSIAQAAKDVIDQKHLTCKLRSAAAYIWYTINGRFRQAYGDTFRYAKENDIIKFNK